MKRILFLSLFLIFFQQLFANDFNIVARVDSEVITQYDLNIYSKLFKEYFANNKFTNNEILDNLIETKLKEKAIKDEKIKYDEKEFEYFFKDFYVKNKIKNQNDKNFIAFLKNRFLWNKLIETKIIPNIDISANEINDALEYLSNEPIRTRYNISQITVYNTPNSNAKSIIDKLYLEIKEKNNFEDIANKFSQDGKENKGYVGWIDEKDINPQIYSAIKNLQIKSTTQPLFLKDSSSGYYMIIKLNDKKQEKTAKNSDIARVKYFLYNQKLTLEIKKYLDNLYNNSFIEKYY